MDHSLETNSYVVSFMLPFLMGKSYISMKSPRQGVSSGSVPRWQSHKGHLRNTGGQAFDPCRVGAAERRGRRQWTRLGGTQPRKEAAPSTEKQETRGAQLNPCQDNTCDGVCVVHFLSCTGRINSPPPTRVSATINLRGQQEVLEKH